VLYAADNQQLCKKDEWVVVENDKMLDPGTVTSVVGSDVDVPVVDRAGDAVVLVVAC